MKCPLPLPNGDFIDAVLIRVVNFNPNNLAVSLKGENGNSLAYMEFDLEEDAKHARSEIIKLIQAIHKKEKYSCEFDREKANKVKGFTK